MVMNQTKKEVHGQIEYMGRWVDKVYFRAFVYNLNEQKLANSYPEYEKLLASGLWFMTKQDAIDSIETNKVNEPVVKLTKEEKKAERVEKVGKIAKEIKEKTFKTDLR